ncbi:MAG: 2-isopropylmalate synthase [Desulfurococcaceae archaeon]
MPNPVVEIEDGEAFYEDVYPYRGVPRVLAADTKIAGNLEKIYLTDTTLRDGQQGSRPFTVKECELIYELLADIGKDGAIYSTELFLYTEKDKTAVKSLKEYGYRYPKVIGWIRATREDVQLLLDTGLDETVVLMSISDYHVKYKFNSTRSRVVSKYLEVAELLLSRGIAVRASLEDVTRANVRGVVIPFIKSLLRLSERYATPLIIKLPDTLGLGLPFPEIPLPRGIPALVETIISETGLRPEQLEFHGHNDFGLVVANHLAAWLHGAAGSNCTLLGIGERAGNCPLEVMAIHYAGIRGEGSINLKAISRMPELFGKLGFSVPEHYPLVGRNAFRTKAGIHVDGLLKNPRVYLPFDPLEVLGIPYSMEVTPYSGRSAVVAWIKKNLGIDVDKTDPRVEVVYREVISAFKGDVKARPLSDEELLEIVKRYFDA